MQANYSIFCLDPSCFSTLEKLRDAKHFLNEIRNNNPSLRVYVPTIIHKTINYEPEQKFRELPSIMKDWIEKDEFENINSMNPDTKDDYVFVMREFLALHNPLPIRELIGDIRKIGKESLYLDDLIKKFGKFSGEILFEIAAISNEYSAKILAFGDKTISIFKDIGTRIVKGTSEVKKRIKSKARIRTPVNIMMYFFVPTPAIYTFIQEFQIKGIQALLDPKFAPIALPLGWFIIANS